MNRRLEEAESIEDRRQICMARRRLRYSERVNGVRRIGISLVLVFATIGAVRSIPCHAEPWGSVNAFPKHSVTHDIFKSDRQSASAGIIQRLVSSKVPV
jgi:hypothetical protein